MECKLAATLTPPPPPALCSLSPSRLWTSATKVAAKPSPRSQERPQSHPGVRCDRCRIGPIIGSCFRCAAGCVAKHRKSSKQLARPAEASRRPSCGAGSSIEDKSRGKGCYTLCETCFFERGHFHPPHPFARLRPGFAELRLAGPELYEAV